MKSEDAARKSNYTGPINVMTVREVSAYLRVHPSTIYRLVKRNQIPAFHVIPLAWGRRAELSFLALDPYAVKCWGEQ